MSPRTTRSGVITGIGSFGSCEPLGLGVSASEASNDLIAAGRFCCWYLDDRVREGSAGQAGVGGEGRAAGLGRLD